MIDDELNFIFCSHIKSRKIFLLHFYFLCFNIIVQIKKGVVGMEGTRLFFWDRIRVQSVYFVIFLHAAMSYMKPLIPWWYANDPGGAPAFTMAVIAIDLFPMSVLFFASGYFAPQSFNKRGAAGFMKEKVTRILGPWALGFFFVAPFFAAATMRSLGYPIGPLFTFYTRIFIGPAYQQAIYWFLMVLFLFFCMYSCVGHMFSKRDEKASVVDLGLLMGLWFLSSVFFYWANYYKPFDDWMNIFNLVYFQHCRLLGYIFIFFLGALAWKRRWFDEEPCTAAAVGSLAFAVICIAIATYLRLQYGGGMGKQLFMYSLAQQAASFAVPFGMALFYRKYFNGQSYKLQVTAEASYGLYWLHTIILMPLIFFLIPFTWPAIVKWALSVWVTILLGQLGAIFVLKKLPVIGKMF